MASVLLAGGGTAGHANPLIATADALAARGHAVAALGTPGGIEVDLVARAGYPFYGVNRVPLPRRPSPALVRLPWALRAAVRQAREAIDASGAAAVVGFGGYVSTPAYLAARAAKVPVVVHEGNARPGLANRLGARWAARVAVTFPGTPLRGATLTGLPLRRVIADLAERLGSAEAASLRASAREHWGFPVDARVLLVTGGSTGAARINQATADAIVGLVSQGVSVLHLTGAGKEAQALAAKEALPADLAASYVVRAYVHEMDLAFAAADAVVCRAGAATVCEVTALGLPAVYVPLAHGNGEQGLNAAAAVEAGAARLLADGALDAATLTEAAVPLLRDAAVRERALQASARIRIVDGAQRLAALIEEVLA